MDLKMEPVGIETDRVVKCINDKRASGNQSNELIYHHNVFIKQEPIEDDGITHEQQCASNEDNIVIKNEFDSHWINHDDNPQTPVTVKQEKEEEVLRSNKIPNVECFDRAEIKIEFDSIDQSSSICDDSTEEKDSNKQAQLGHDDSNDGTETQFELDDKYDTLESLKSSKVQKKRLRRAGNKTFHCDQCSYTTKKHSHLVSHQYVHTDAKPFKCDVCDYTCKQFNFLHAHKRSHSDHKPFACEFCDYRCKVQNSLKRHKVIHSNKKPFSCQFCKFACKEQRRLKMHTVANHSEEPFRCSKCEYFTTEFKHFKRHKITHTDHPYACAHCRFRCKERSELDTHKSSHSFKCNSCTFVTWDMSELKAHKATHRSGIKILNFKCDVCPFKAKYSRELKLHKVGHGPDESAAKKAMKKVKMFYCDSCDHEAKTLKELKKHKVVHESAVSDESSQQTSQDNMIYIDIDES